MKLTAAFWRWGRNWAGSIALAVACFAFLPMNAAIAQNPPGGRVFDVATFGATPNDDSNDREAIRKAIQAAIAAGPHSTVKFSPGVYRINLSAAELAQKPVHTPKAFNKRLFLYFDFNGARNLTLKGDQTQLLVQDPRAVLFDFHGSEHCLVEGLTIDLDPLPYTQGKITAVNPAQKTFDIEIMKGFPLLGAYPWLTFGPQSDWQNRLLVFGESDPKTSDRSRRGVKQLLFEFRPRLGSVRDILSFAPLGERSFRITSTVALDSKIRRGNILVYSSKVGGGPLIDAGGVNLQFTDTTIYTSPGFTLASSYADNLRLTRFAIRLKPGTERLVTSTSDGVHTRATRGGPHVENCIFENIQDDIFNISANPIPITKVVSEKELLVDNSIKSSISDTRSTRGRVDVGDTVYAYANPEAKIKGEAKVVSLTNGKGKKDPKRLVLDRPIPGIVSTDCLYSREASNAGVIIRNSTFRGGLRSAIMHMAGDGTLIENNLFENMRKAISICESRTSTKHGQGGIVRNITIRNNEIRACHVDATEHENHPDAAIGIMLFPDSTSRGVTNVLIEGNKIYEPGLYGIWLSNVTGARLLNNKIVAYSDSLLPSDNHQERRALRIHNSQDVLVDALTIDEPRADLKAAISIDSKSEKIHLKNIDCHILHGDRIKKNDNPTLREVGD